MYVFRNGSRQQTTDEAPEAKTAEVGSAKGAAGDVQTS